MKKLSWVLLLAFLAAVASGCASGPTTYQVQVNGYTASGGLAPFVPMASFFVMENEEAKNPLLEKEIRAKITKLLEQRGYSLVPYEQADYYLRFTYGMGAPQTVSVATPSIGIGIGFGTGIGCYGPGGYGAYGLFWPGYSPYYTETQALFNRWLILNVGEGEHYRVTGKFNTVWVGEARSTGTSSDFREVVNSLLITAFEQFGRNTGKAVPADVSQKDPRFKELEGIR